MRGSERSLQLHTPVRDAAGRCVTTARALRVKIPPGIVPGQRIRLTGQGQPGIGGGARGDLYLEVEIAPHRLYRLEGRDVYLDLPITPWEAALGATVKIPTLDGAVDLKIPSGSQSGRKLRLRGKGLGCGQRGDQYVVLQIVTPSANSDSEVVKKPATQPDSGVGRCSLLAYLSDMSRRCAPSAWLSG
ncbi:MAG: DnaJ C-terminal domain-containing protein, partial [Gammaproteobacteria bacterium]